MDRVAEPPPALASTTSVPASWMRLVSASVSAASKLTFGVAWESSGRMVVPAWPPMTGTFTVATSKPLASATKVLARTTSRVDTPNSFSFLYTLCFLRISAAMGTVEFTGLLMMLITALGACLATPSMRVFTIPALMLKRSSRVIPGLRGTPAGMTTRSAPSSALPRFSGPTKPSAVEGVLQWLRSLATPGVTGATSYRLSSLTSLFIFSSRPSGCPMPPAAPRSATL
mmetsp:Transcript_9001/g.26978  ORF Transcript_9001/g.26978 Transcript_9001/m.26978 type:complete len:228 (+) Transcript_9001:539-1222(+)